MKQRKEPIKFIKKPGEPTRNYIFQKNRKTKLGAIVISVFLVLLIIGVALSLFFFSKAN